MSKEFGEQMDLGLGINIEATAKEVDNFLSKEFQHYLNRAGRTRSSLSSPQLSEAPGGTHYDHANEDAIIEGMFAQNVVSCIHQTIIKCSNSGDHPYATILFSLYVEQNTVKRTSQLIGFSMRQTFVKKQLACCEFADRFEHEKQVYQVADLPCLIA